MNIRVGHTKNNETVITTPRLTAWTFDDVIRYVPHHIIRSVQAFDGWAQQKLEAETRTQREGFPGGMIGADVMDDYFRQWHAMGAITDKELDDLLNGTVG